MQPELYFNVEVNNEYFRGRSVADGSMRRAVREKESGEETVYRLPVGDDALTVTVIRRRFGAAERCCTEVRGGARPVLLSGVASLYYQGIPVDGNWWSDTGRFSVHLCRSVWQGEGQWQEYSLRDLGLYPTYNHQAFSAVKLSSVGSWTTGNTYPLVILQDRKEGVCWCVEPECSAGRYLEIGCQTHADGSETLYLYVSSANERANGWHKRLQPGEVYRTEPTAFCRVKGGFDEAVAAMTDYKRRTSQVSFPHGVPPICFNDYMNCLWARPSREKLLPLIDAAAQAGCEVFCIDAGWYGDFSGDVSNAGDWIPDDARFGPEGLQGVLDQIKNRGMIPGLWLELESVGPRSEFFRAHPEGKLTRNGAVIPRGFADVRLPAVQKHLEERVDALCAMGVGYFKNDYNGSLEAGCDSLAGGTLADGAREYADAFRGMIDRIVARHPGLIIENCGSGAMRADNGTLSHFHLQSVTDQEDYLRMPSVVQGSLACYPPEKTGIWAYPYPLRYARKTEGSAEVPDGDAETCFNLALALFGCFYLSGHIELADGAGKERLREAVNVYRRVRPVICRSSAVFPLGTHRLDYEGIVPVALFDPEEKQVLLGLFDTSGNGGTVRADLSRWCGAGAVAELLFPSGSAPFGINGSVLSVNLPAGHACAVFSVRGKDE